MLKPFHERKDKEVVEEKEEKCVSVISATSDIEEEWAEAKLSRCEGMVLQNSEVLSNIRGKLGHMEGEEKDKVIELIGKYMSLFPDAPRKTSVVVHDVKWR